MVVVKVATESIPGGGGTRKRIQVSALPSGMNAVGRLHSTVRGRITSVEDHGCLVDLGHHQTGFLAFENVEGDYSVNGNDNNNSDKRLLNAGRLYDFMVKEKHSTSKVVPLSLPLVSKMAHTLVSSTDEYTLQTLHPGMLVQARVEALARNGVCVVFLGNAFRGCH